MQLSSFDIIRLSPPLYKPERYVIILVILCAHFDALIRIKQEVIEMKLERISENKIRCILTHSDLSSRQIMLGELAYGSAKAKALFRDMMDLAAEELGFETDDMPIVVEAVPMENGSIVLTISKVDNPEELDARFSRFTPYADAAEEEEDTDETPSLWQAACEFDLDEDELTGIFSGEEQDTAVFRFDSLSEVTDMSRHLPKSIPCLNTLYKNPRTGHYYLAVRRYAAYEKDYLLFCRLASEYGSSCRQTDIHPFLCHIREHYTLILADRAAQRLRDL